MRTIEWPVLLTIVSSVVLTVGITGGVLIRVFTWIYAESNNLRADFGKLRTEVSQTYVTLEAQKIIKGAIDERGDHLETAVNGLSAAVDRLSDKQDRSIAELAHGWSVLNSSRLPLRGSAIGVAAVSTRRVDKPVASRHPMIRSARVRHRLMVKFPQARYGSARGPRPRCGRLLASRALFLLFGLTITTTFLASLGLTGPDAFITAACAAEGSANGRAKVGRSAPQRNRCLSRQEQRARVAVRAAIPLRKAVRAVKGRGDLLRARLCERRGKLLYLLTILGRRGKVLRVTINAKTGKPVGAPR